MRLIVRRVKPTPGSQLALFATCSYHGFITGRDGETLELEAGHRRHAEVENAIRDLKYGVGLNHLPSGRFAANAAWLAVQALAHNLARWAARIGLGEQLATTKTLRRRFFSMAGGSPARRADSLCIFPGAGPGLSRPLSPWPGCEPFHSQPDGARLPLTRLRPTERPANSRHPGPRAPLAVPYPAISLATATAGRHRCPQSACRPPVYPNSSPDHNACNSLTAPSTVLTPSIRVHRWIRA